MTEPQPDATTLTAMSRSRLGVLVRDPAVAIAGGVVLCGVGLWWLLQAQAAVDDTPREVFLGRAWLYGGLGLLALVPGLLGLALRAQRPRVARFMWVFGRVVVAATVCLYIIGSLALSM